MVGAHIMLLRFDKNIMRVFSNLNQIAEKAGNK